MDSIALYLKPKSEVAYCESDMCVRQLIEKMDYYGFSAIPILDSKGRYIGTITEGDVLRTFRRKYAKSWSSIQKIKLMDIKRKKLYSPVLITAKMEDLFSALENQNFVPVIDDNHIFIGIVTRARLINDLKSCVEEKYDVE